MPPAPRKSKAKKPRGPVSYVAFVEAANGLWLRVGPRGASSVYALRKELLVELREKLSIHGTTRMVIVPTAQAHIVAHEHEVIERDIFTPAKLDVAEVPDMPDMPQVIALPDAGDVPPSGMIEPLIGDELPDRDATPEEAERDAAAAAASQAALAAEAAAREGQVLPVDPDDDDEDARNPDVDPSTGISRRSAAEATPADEGRTVFPIDE